MNCLFICILAADQRELYGLIIKVLFISTADAAVYGGLTRFGKIPQLLICWLCSFAEDEASI